MENGLGGLGVGGSDLGVVPQAGPVVKAGPVVVVDAEESLEQVRAWYKDWDTATKDARDVSLQCRDYYDGDQWTQEEIDILRSRRQPVITVNRLAKKVDYLTGSEIRTRSDPEAMPRTPMHDDEASAITDALRYVADDACLPSVYSNAFESMLIEGTGAVIVEVEEQEVETPISSEVQLSGTGTIEKKHEIKVKHVPWDRIWIDPHSRAPDASDAKYLGTVTWMDEDDIVAEYGEGVSELLASTRPGGTDSVADTHEDQPATWWDGSRERYLVVECYWRVGKLWMCGHACGGGWLWGPQPTAIKDENGNSMCPLVIASAKVKRNGDRYGIVAGLLSLQDEVNKRRSKALHALNVTGVLAEDGVTTDKHGFMAELARPDGYAVVARNALSEGRLQIRAGTELAAGQLQLLQEAVSQIDTIGPDAQSFAGEGGSSGRAILARQQLGSTELERVFDHFRGLKRQTLRLIFFAIRQYWTVEKWLRVRDEAQDAGYRFVALNRVLTVAQRMQEQIKRGMEPQEAVEATHNPWAIQAYGQTMQAIQASPQGQQIPPEAVQQAAMQAAMQAPLMDRLVKDNDVSQVDVDIVLTESPDVAVVQQEEFDRLAAMAQSGVPIPPDILIEASQLRNKKRLLDMLKSQQGQGQEQAAQQAKLAQQAQTLALQQAQAQVQKTGAEAAAAAARAQKDQAQAQATMPAAAKDAAGAQLAQAQAAKATVETEKARTEMTVEQYRALMAARQADYAASGMLR